MDIISEILETDRLAEEKLEQAMQKRSEMLEACTAKAEEIRSSARAQAEEYRKSKLGADNAADISSELKAGEQAQLKALAESYDKNHEAWENDIVAAITG